MGPEDLALIGAACSVIVMNVCLLCLGFQSVRHHFGDPPVPVAPRVVPLLRQDADQLTFSETTKVQFFTELFEAIDADTPVPEVDQLPELPPVGYGLRDE